MKGEQRVQLKVSPRVANIITSLMPTLDGLYLATTESNSKGQLTLIYDSSQEQQIEATIDFLSDRFPHELVRLSLDTWS